MSRSRRARGWLAASSLMLVSGCVLLTGVGDLAEGPQEDAGTDDVRVDGTMPVSDVVTPPRTDATPSVDADTEDARADLDAGLDARPDTSMPDTSVPDTSLPDTGPADTGTTSTSASVKCTSGNACMGATPVCCIAPFTGLGGCTAAASCGATGAIACDDDSDCAENTICCISWSSFTVTASSRCASTCTTATGVGGASGTGRACDGVKAVCAQGESCAATPIGPGTLRACQRQ